MSIIHRPHPPHPTLIPAPHPPHFRLAPVQTQHPDESCDEFTVRVQRFMCEQLRLQSTPHTSRDKVEYAKRVLFTVSASAVDDCKNGYRVLPSVNDGRLVLHGCDSLNLSYRLGRHF